MPRNVLILTLVLLASPVTMNAIDAPAAQFAHEWPQWRGPLGTGVAPHGDPPLTWSESENLRWKVELPGRGHASPIVWGDRVFVLAAVEVESTPAETGDTGSAPGGPGGRGIQPETPMRFVVLAFDRTTGALSWERTAQTTVPHEGTHRTATWASASGSPCLASSR